MRNLQLLCSRYDGAKPLKDYGTLIPGEILMVKAYEYNDGGYSYDLGYLFAKVLSAQPPKPAGWFTVGTFGEATLQLPNGQTVTITGGDQSVPPILMAALRENYCNSWSYVRDVRLKLFSFDRDLVELKETMQKYQQSRDAYRKREAEETARRLAAQQQREQEVQARRAQSASMANEIEQMFRNSTK